MLVKRERQFNEMRRLAYSIAVGSYEKEQRRKNEKSIKDKQRAVMNTIMSTFYMFYGRYFSSEEWDNIKVKFSCPREAKGIIDRLSKELEAKEIDKSKWLEIATKMFL